MCVCVDLCVYNCACVFLAYNIAVVILILDSRRCHERAINATRDYIILRRRLILTGYARPRAPRRSSRWRNIHFALYSWKAAFFFFAILLSRCFYSDGTSAHCIFFYTTVHKTNISPISFSLHHYIIHTSYSCIVVMTVLRPHARAFKFYTIHIIFLRASTMTRITIII